MDYVIRTPTALASTEMLEAAIRALDPAAVMDLSTDGHTVRLSTVLGSQGLAFLFAEAGHPLPADAVTVQPSVCCGGCSG